MNLIDNFFLKSFTRFLFHLHKFEILLNPLHLLLLRMIDQIDIFFLFLTNNNREYEETTTRNSI